jgi:hypothetical protein
VSNQIQEIFVFLPVFFAKNIYFKNFSGVYVENKLCSKNIKTNVKNIKTNVNRLSIFQVFKATRMYVVSFSKK